MMPRPRAAELAAPPGRVVRRGPRARRRRRGRLRGRPPALTEEAGELLTRAVERLLAVRSRAGASRAGRRNHRGAGRLCDVGAEHLAEALSYRAPAEVAG